MVDTLINRVAKLALNQPDQLAVAFKSEQLTYRQLLEKIKLVGNRLSDMGVGRGERVLFMALSKPEMVAVYLGIQYCGAVAVFIDKNATVENIEFVYQDTDAVLLLSDKPMKNISSHVRMS